MLLTVRKRLAYKEQALMRQVFLLGVHSGLVRDLGGLFSQGLLLRDLCCLVLMRPCSRIRTLLASLVWVLLSLEPISTDKGLG